MSEKTVFVLIDHSDGKARSASLESLALAQQLTQRLGASLKILLLGHGVDALAQELAQYRSQGVLQVESPSLAAYDPDASCEALVQMLRRHSPQLLLMAHIYQNIDMAPKLAAALNRALLTDCIGYRLEGGELRFIRQMFRNKLNARVRILSEPPWLITLQSGVASLDQLESGSAPVEKESLDLSHLSLRRRPLETIQAMKGKVDLSKAEVIVGVGRGIKKAENLALIKELAEVLGGEIGASRPVVDNEWLERERQIGSSGQTVTPRLYIACGISGAIQHIVGMKNSQCIVAINTDPNAPIFNIATYGIVGDLFEVVPALIRKLREAKEGS